MCLDLCPSFRAVCKSSMIDNFTPCKDIVSGDGKWKQILTRSFLNKCNSKTDVCSQLFPSCQNLKNMGRITFKARLTLKVQQKHKRNYFGAEPFFFFFLNNNVKLTCSKSVLFVETVDLKYVQWRWTFHRNIGIFFPYHLCQTFITRSMLHSSL